MRRVFEFPYSTGPDTFGFYITYIVGSYNRICNLMNSPVLRINSVGSGFADCSTWNVPEAQL